MSNIYEPSLFTDESGNEIDYETLEVISCKYLSTKRVTWQELFDGYDELYAITFSSGIDFTAKLLNKFTYAEIIYGCSNIINSQVSAIIAAQQVIVETISKSKAANTISAKVSAEQLRLYVSMDTNSHEKIFILKSNDGKTRVITGSANMSASAFAGLQREEILYFDDSAAFEYFMKRFEDFRSKCVNRIEKETIQAVIADKDFLKEHIENVPVLNEARKQIQINITKSDDGVDYIANVKNLEKDIKDLLPKGKAKQNNICVSTDMVNVIRKNNRDFIDRVKRERQLPILHLDMENEELRFGQKLVNLNPDPMSVAKDIESTLGFLNGFEAFNGNYKTAQKDYFSYMNWFFATIFIPKLRLLAYKHGYSLYYFPIFGILCGPSNAGKTKVVELFSKLMTGEKIVPSGSDIFCSREMEKLRRSCEGVPIMIEDLAKQQYDSNYEKILKDDYYGMDIKNVHYPAVSITANKIQSLTPDATKRAVYFRTDISTDKETGAKNSKSVNDNITAVSNALFAEYVRRMIPIVKNMENNMLCGVKDYSPDILKESSIVLVSIFKEYNGNVPNYVRQLAFNDYFGDKVIGRSAIEKIQSAYKNQRYSFAINKKENTLTYTVSDSSSYEIGYLANELPSSLNAKKFGNMLVMNLTEAKEVFGINFKKSLFKR